MITSDLLNRGIFKFTYNGVPCWKCPFDYALYQKLIFDIQPDLIIEIGTNQGGSALYIADLLNLVGKGSIHSIDLEDKVSDIKVRQHPRIKLFLGGWQDYEIHNIEGFNKILIIDDGSHFYEDVLGVLNKFSNAHYIIVEDGVLGQMGVANDYGGGPVKAIHEFLTLHPEFEIDRNLCDFFGPNLTYNTDGYLKRK